MTNAKPNLIARDDTLLGVCEALGEDFGFNPLFLRIAFAVSLLWSPLLSVAVYLGVGLLVLLSRWMAPNARRAEVSSTGEPATEAEPLPLAA